MDLSLASCLGDPARLRELANSELMDNAPEERFDRYTGLGAELLQAPICLLSLVDERRQIIKSARGLAEPWASQRELPLSRIFCQHAVESGQPVIVTDARSDPRVCDNGAVPDLGAISYAGYPLVAAGQILGVFSVIDTQPRAWNDEQLRILRTLSEALSSELAHSLARNQLRQQGELMRALSETLDSAPIGMALVALDGKWLRVNDAVCRIVGYPRDELLRMDFQRITHHEDLESDLAYVQQLLAGAIPSYTMEKRYIHRDGHVVWIHLSVSLVRDADGQPSFFISQIQDITERLNAEVQRRSAERELRHKQQSLTASLRERDVLLREVHHRVKSNLQMVSSLIGMQVRRSYDGASAIALLECRHRVEAIALIHDELMKSNDYARVPFAEYARSLTNNLFFASGRMPDQVQIEFALDDVAVPIDRAIPCGLLLNELVTNALKHAFPDDRHGLLRISLKRIGHYGVELAVIDDGVGFPLEQVQLDSSLGMQLIETLAEQLGGTLRLVTTRGTAASVTFSVEVPEVALMPGLSMPSR